MTREEAINELKILREEYWDDDGYGHETHQYDDTITAIDMAIKELEQTDVLDREVHEPKVGHWIMTGDYYTGAYECIDYVECSCCHEESLEEGNYCPNCGAKMDGVETEVEE